MDDNTLTKKVINNEYDYSNIIPTADAVAYLVQFCDQMNKKLLKLIEEDEEKNKQFKIEYKEYKYKKSYSQRFDVYIREKNYNNITCNDYEQYISAVKGGNLKNINGMDIRLNMNFYRGKGFDEEEHENSFAIEFKPYEITFARKSNHDDPNMNKIEDQINSILKQFPVANSIFCDKSDNY